ncbi:MAG: hypothetical protein EOO09_19385 [Chitinophagaceae bacterium]|nr:MAG: hypothetical protein EOO09_19385 [Chitinophagaceae bacterium]
MKRLLLPFILLLPFLGSGQEAPGRELTDADYDSFGASADSIVAEGTRLFRLEMASWYGTDLFLENFKDRNRIGGYLSYMNDRTPTCIFFSQGESPAILGTIMFDSTYNVKTATIDLEERKMTAVETDYHQLRKAGMEFINSGDTLFKVYDNTSLNMIPLIHEGRRRMYVLTGPKDNGVVVFGNDYLLEFDNNNRLTSRRRLHANLIMVKYGKGETGAPEQVGSMHTHLPETGNFHTATDICTLLLYGRFTNWQQHNVISENFYTIWDMKKQQLTPITREALKKINEHQQSKKKNK